MCYAIEPFPRRKMRATFNYSINYVTARSRLFLLRTRARSATRWLGKPANPVCTIAQSSSLTLSLPLYCPSLPSRQDSVMHLSPFGCPETERKHRRDPAGMDGEHIREDVVASRSSPPDKPHPGVRSHVETTNSDRAPVLLHPYSPLTD